MDWRSVFCLSPAADIPEEVKNFTGKEQKRKGNQYPHKKGQEHQCSSV